MSCILIKINNNNNNNNNNEFKGKTKTVLMSLMIKLTFDSMKCIANDKNEP